MKCRYCNNEAVTVRDKKRICKEHFNGYYIKRLKKVIRNTPIENKKILLAISGGKDSVALVHALSSLKEYYKFQMELIFIDLGINDFSKYSFDLSENLAKQLDLKLNIFGLKNNFNISVSQIGKITKKVCSYCGTIKRYVLNKFAFENNFDFVITGHNMDDEIIFLQQNIIAGAVEYVKRYSYFYTETLKEKKLIGKIKPQYFLSEKDNIDYCKINNLEYVNETCPYSEGSTHNKLYKGIEFLNDNMQYSFNFLQFFIKINNYLPEKEIDFKFCINCGFPTTNYEKCKFCKTIELIKN